MTSAEPSDRQASWNGGPVGPPTGRQHEIRWGPHRAVVVELGGGLR
jgi:hypothetical protein